MHDSAIKMVPVMTTFMTKDLEIGGNEFLSDK